MLQRLAHLTGEGKWQEAADRQMRFLADSIGEYPAGSCFGLLAMMDALYPHKELVCAATSGIPEELLAHLREKTADNLHILLKTKENAEALTQCAPFTADYPIPEQGAMYYLCENGACKAPVSDFSKLDL